MSKWIVTIVDVSTNKETFKAIEGSFGSLQEALETWSTLSPNQKVLGKKYLPKKSKNIREENEV